VIPEKQPFLHCFQMCFCIFCQLTLEFLHLNYFILFCWDQTLCLEPSHCFQQMCVKAFTSKREIIKKSIEILLRENVRESKMSQIVISGCSGRFPESANLQEFSDNLFNGVDMISGKQIKISLEKITLFSLL